MTRGGEEVSDLLPPTSRLMPILPLSNGYLPKTIPTQFLLLSMVLLHGME